MNVDITLAALRQCQRASKVISPFIIMDARSAMRPCYILPMFFFIFFCMAALVGQTAERIFTKLSHVVDIRCYLHIMVENSKNNER